MKNKLIEAVKITIIMVILFLMAYAKIFPIYWRLASAIWFLVFFISLLDELYKYIKSLK